MYCPFCGENISKNSSFCFKCGQSLKEDKKRKIAIPKRFFIVGLCAVFIIGLIFWNNQQGGILPKMVKRTIPLFGSIYPEDYILNPNEIPPGFQLKPVDEEMRRAGIASNPGFANEEVVQEIKASQEAFVSGIEQVYFAIYMKEGEPSDLSISVFKYTSKNTLDLAVEEAIRQKEFPRNAAVLRDENILVIISGGTDELINEIEEVAKRLKAKTGLIEISNIVADEPQNQRPTEIPIPSPTLKVLTANVKADDDDFLGPKDAKVTVIVFSDYQCPYCAAVEGYNKAAIESLKSRDPTWEAPGPKLKELAKEGKIKYVFRDFALPSHAFAQKAAEATECAGEQGKFWGMQEKVFASQAEWSTVSDLITAFKNYAKELGLETAEFDNCLDSGQMAEEVKKDFSDGQTAGVTGTPAFFVNGQQVAGARSFSFLESLINEELAK